MPFYPNLKGSFPNVNLHFTYYTTNNSPKTQFEIKCRCGGHSVTQKFMRILQIQVAKPKL